LKVSTCDRAIASEIHIEGWLGGDPNTELKEIRAKIDPGIASGTRMDACQLYTDPPEKLSWISRTGSH
jgi:hypothetical protein